VTAIFGTAYRIAEIADRNVKVVAKLRKDRLVRVTGRQERSAERWA